MAPGLLLLTAFCRFLLVCFRVSSAFSILLVFIFLVPFCCSGWVLWGSRPRFPKPQTRLQALPWGRRLLSQCLRWSSAFSVKPGGHAGAAVSRGWPLVKRGPSTSPGTPAELQVLTGRVQRAVAISGSPMRTGSPSQTLGGQCCLGVQAESRACLHDSMCAFSPRGV